MWFIAKPIKKLHRHVSEVYVAQIFTQSLRSYFICDTTGITNMIFLYYSANIKASRCNILTLEYNVFFGACTKLLSN